MPIGANIQAWRCARGHSLEALADKAGLSVASLGAIEAGTLDPPASTLEALAAAIGIPVPWLYTEPTHVALLTTDPDGEALAPPPPDAVDPVTDRVSRGVGQARELYVLLTALLQSGNPKLLLTAETNLRSLVKQARRPTIPWQSRPSGHFEPPSD